MSTMEIPRDRFGRPMIIPVGGGAPVGYTRASKVGGEWDDKFFLNQWIQRKVVEGLVLKPELTLRASVNLGSNSVLNDVARTAIEVAGGGTAATIGTALHAMTELMDAGEPVAIPPEYAADLHAYRTAVSGMTMIQSEGFIVVDDLAIGGSFDRIWDTPAGIMIGDLKTGSRVYGHSAAVQMALYAHGQLYDPATGERTPLPTGLRQDIALLMHMPQKKGECTVHEVDIASGWLWAQRFAELKAFRKSKITQPYTSGPSTVTTKGSK